MSAAAALARAEAAGVRFRLAPGGGVRMEAAAPPPPDVLADLRRWRADVADLLAARQRQERPPVLLRPGDARDAWGLSEPEKVAALSRLAEMPAHRAAATPTPAPPADWWQLPYGEERGRAFAKARAMPGACSCCAGRRWWREADEVPPGRCMACHPPPPGLAVTVTETRAGTHQPGDPDPLRDGLLRGWRDHRNPR